MDKQLASAKIAALLTQADALLAEAVMVSEQSGIEFTLPWGGEGSSESGMGATYYPESHPELGGNHWRDIRQGWNPSAHTC